ncbi:MAG: hypothetical protein AAGG51_26630 [Cyanobacteria bacterium P01_G01_bin.54]
MPTLREIGSLLNPEVSDRLQTLGLLIGPNRRQEVRALVLGLQLEAAINTGRLLTRGTDPHSTGVVTQRLRRL